MKNKANLTPHPAISVVLPAYNEERLIEKCLTHLVQQDFHEPFEIIVVNGPSTDQTRKIAEKYADLVIDQTGIGIGQARYQGCKQAKGELLAITDADVFVPKNWLSTVAAFFMEHPKVVALTGPYRFVDSEPLNRAAKITRPIGNAFHILLTGGAPLSGTNTAMQREAYFNAGEFDPQITGLEDVELGTRLIKLGQIAYLPNLVVETTQRRYKKPLQHIFTTLLPAYFKRMVLKTKDKKVIWKKIEEESF